MIKRIAAVLFALAVALGLSAATTLPAQATHNGSSSYMQVCNSSASVAVIRVKSVTSSTVNNLQPEECSISFWNGDDNVRVNTDYETGGFPDVDSYKIGHISAGYGPCHENSENENSNPPDSYNGSDPTGGARYRNYTGGSC